MVKANRRGSNFDPFSGSRNADTVNTTVLMVVWFRPENFKANVAESSRPSAEGCAPGRAPSSESLLFPSTDN